MADGIIQRIVRLVLDRQSAAEVERGVGQTAERSENALTRLRASALKLAAAFAAAFSVAKLIQFGRESVRLAAEQEERWRGLQAAVDATDQSFAALEPSIRAAASAFQDATVWGDDEYAEALGRLTTLTGDFTAASQNMGLVANVAAGFFKGELAPAADLVGRVMNGNTAILTRMGLSVTSAEEGLRLLSERTMGRAAAQAETFNGKLRSLNNLWGDFREELGMVLTEHGHVASAMDVLRGVLVTMVRWVDENSEAMSRWVGTGIRWTVLALGTLLNTLIGLGQFFTGTFRVVLGLAGRGFAIFGDIISGVTRRLAGIARVLGMDGVAGGLQDYTDRLRAGTEALKDWADQNVVAGGLLARAGLDRNLIPDFPGQPTARPGLGPINPVLGRNARDKEGEKEKKTKEEVDKVREAFLALDAAMEQNRTLSLLLGDEFDARAAEAAALSSALSALAAAGLTEADVQMQALAARLRALGAETSEVDKIFARFREETVQNAALANLLGKEFNVLEAEAGLLMRTIQALVDEGLAPSDERLLSLVQRLAEVRAAIAQTENAFDAGALAAEFFGEAAAAAIGANIGPHAAGRAKVAALEAVEHWIRAGASLLFGNPVAAAKNAKLAGEYTALAAAWGSLAATFGGGGSSRPSGGGGAAMAAARDPAGVGTRDGGQLPPQVTIQLVGPGFHAANPEVQRVVWATMSEARRRYGPNVRLDVERR